MNELPELSGAVPASKKGECEVLLLGEKANVLAARFQCGRGRVFAFTSDAKADWAKLWVEWPGYSTFWSQALEDVLRPPQAYRVTSRRFERSGKVLFVFYVQHEDGTPAEELMGSGSFAAEERGSSTQPVARAGVSDPAIQCSQKVAGEYHFSIDVPPVGHARLALLSLSNSLSPVVNYAAMVSAGMTEEMAATGPDLAAAAAIAEVGNGIVVDDPARVGRAVPKPYEMIVEADRPLWRYLLIAALALWPIDVLVRKVM